MSKAAFVVGAAIGYVLGARAGRKRYEQIKGQASKTVELRPRSAPGRRRHPGGQAAGSALRHREARRCDEVGQPVDAQHLGAVDARSDREAPGDPAPRHRRPSARRHDRNGARGTSFPDRPPSCSGPYGFPARHTTTTCGGRHSPVSERLPASTLRDHECAPDRRPGGLWSVTPMAVALFVQVVNGFVADVPAGPAGVADRPPGAAVGDPAAGVPRPYPDVPAAGRGGGALVHDGLLRGAVLHAAQRVRAAGRPGRSRCR